MTSRTFSIPPSPTLPLAEARPSGSDRAWQDALASDAMLVAYLRHLANQRASELDLQRSSWRAPRSGSLKLGPSARARNSPGLAPVQRRKAR